MCIRLGLFRSLLLSMAAFGSFGYAGQPSVEVREVRVQTAGDDTRVVLELTGSAQHTLAVLKSPDRIVLDVMGARLGRGVQAVPAAGGAIKEVRVGKRSSGDLRIVFDLARPIRAKSSLMEPTQHAGYRLLIDLRSAGSVETPVKVEHARPDARTLVIAIDAGHGGEDPGAIGKFGTQEKDVVLAIARALAVRVNAEPGMRAVLTRDADYFVPLRDRMRRARAQLPLRLGTIHRLKFLQRRQQPIDVFRIAGMHYVEIESGHGRSVKDRAHATYDDELNAVPGQDFEDFQELGTGTLHGV